MNRSSKLGLNIGPAALIIVAWIILLLLFPAAAMAQSAKTTTAPAGSVPNDKRKVSIDFNNVDIGVFIKFISELTGKNFVINQRVKGKVTIISPGKISVAEAYKVFESVLEVNGLAAVPAGEIIKIVPSPEARSKSVETRLAGTPGKSEDRIVTQIIPLRYADPTEIKRLFAPLISKSSLVVAYPATNTLIITDYYSNIKRLMAILKAIDITGVGQQVSVIPVEYADASKLVKILTTVFNPRKIRKRPPLERQLTVVADDRTNTIILRATEADTERIKRLVKILDKKAPKGKETIHVYYLNHADAEDLAKVLQEFPKKSSSTARKGKQQEPVISDKVRITADKATNSLIIMADKQDYLALENIIKKVDIPRSMVYIEALIMEVNVNKDFRLGTEWMAGGQTKYKGKDAIYGGGFSGGAIGGDPGYSVTAPLGPDGTRIPLLPPGFSVGVFGEALTISGVTFPSLSAVIQAYKKDRDVHILSTPQILTTDNEEAKIYVGKNVPFQTKATTTNNDTFNSFEYRDVGKTLKITPHISQERMVRLELSLEVTVLESTTEFRPTTLKRTVETTVIVRDNNTVVLGGLIDDATSETDYRVPCLGEIPGLGWLFRSTSKGRLKSNLYVFLTPRVIKTPEEAASVYRQKKDQIDIIRGGKIKLYNEEGKLPEESTLPGPPQVEAFRYSQGTLDQGNPAGNNPNPPVEPASLSAAPGATGKQPAHQQDSVKDGETTAVSSPSQPAVPEPAQVPKPPALELEQEPMAAAAKNIPAENKVNKPDQLAPTGYTIQVASLKTPAIAEQMLSELTRKGYPAYTVRTTTKGSTWYRLRVGYFESRKDALEMAKRLKTDHYQPLLVKF